MMSLLSVVPVPTSIYTKTLLAVEGIPIVDNDNSEGLFALSTMLVKGAFGKGVHMLA